RALAGLARRLQGRRASSVFTPPPRPLLEATHYEQVRGHGLSIQAFNIMAKMCEVDCVMTPALQHRVYEAHPELAFRTLAGHPMQYRKKTMAGREERVRVLEQAAHPLFQGIRSAVAQALRGYPRARSRLMMSWMRMSSWVLPGVSGRPKASGCRVSRRVIRRGCVWRSGINQRAFA